MLGRDHAAFGALVGLGVGALGGPVGAVVGALAGGGASLLPDIDEPGSSVSKLLGPITTSASHAIARASGGHRNATHSPVGALLFGGVLAAVFTLVPGGLGAAVSVGCLAGLFARALVTEVHLGRRVRRVVAVVVGVAVGLFVARVGVGTPVLLAAVAGYGAHIACDWVTSSGVPLAWPASRHHYGTGWLKTGSAAEQVVGFGVWLVLGIVSYLLLKDSGPQLLAAIASSFGAHPHAGLSLARGPAGSDLWRFPQ